MKTHAALTLAGKYITYEEARSITQNFSYHLSVTGCFAFPAGLVRTLLQNIATDVLLQFWPAQQNDLPDLLLTGKPGSAGTAYGISAVDGDTVAGIDMKERSEATTYDTGGVRVIYFNPALIQRLTDHCTDVLLVYPGQHEGRLALVLTADYHADIPYSERLFVDLGQVCPPNCLADQYF
jgi:hypothetical protein